MAYEFNPFKTVYSSNFEGTPTERVKPILPPRDSPNILAAPYEEPMLTDYESEKCQKLTEKERAAEYYQKLIRKKPSLKKCLDSFPDQDVLKKDKLNDGKSVYQVAYCKEEVRVEKKTVIEPPKLPTAETVTARSYRDPRLLKEVLGMDIAKTTPAEPMKCSLDLEPEMKKLLCAETGLTEYQSVIGSVGGEIIEQGYFKSKRQDGGKQK